MYMTFDEASSRLFTVLETAIYNYEIETMVEAAEGETEATPAEKKSKLAGLRNVAGKVWKSVWGFILKAIDAILRKLMAWRGPVRVTKDMEIYPGVLSFDGRLMKYADELSRGNFSNYQDAMQYCGDIQNGGTTKKISEGSLIMGKPIASAYEKYKAAVIRLDAAGSRFVGDGEEMAKINSAIKVTAKVLGLYVGQCTEIVNMYNDEDKARLAELMGKKREKLDKKAQRQQERFNKKQNPTNESGYDEYYLSQALLSEAARLLEEEDDEYPADSVTGGRGSDQSEDITDLLKGDKEALKLLTDEEGSSITESIIVF